MRKIKYFSILFFLYYLQVFAQDTLRIEDLQKMEIEDLMEIEITTAGKKPEMLSEIPASVIVITRADIEKYGYKSLIEIFEHIPGLYVNKGYKDDGVGIRGFFAEYNVIYLVNGVNQHEKAPIVPIEAIDKIEIVRGPMSIFYGSGAFLGAINIITNEISNPQQPNFISASGGSFHTFSGFGRFAKKTNDFKIVVNTNFYKTDGLDIPYKDLIEKPENLPLLGIDQNATTKKQLQRNLLYFNSYTQFHKLFFDYTFISDYKEELYFYPSIGNGSPTKKNHNYISMGYHNNFGKKLVAEARIDYWKRIRNFNFNFGNIKGNDSIYFDEEYKESRAIGEIDLHYTPIEKLKITLGIYSKIELEGTDKADIPFYGSYLTNSDLYFLAETDYAFNNAAFTQINYKINDWIKIITGLRVEKMSAFDMHHDIMQGSKKQSSFDTSFAGSDIYYIPRFAAIITPNHNNAIKLLYGESIYFPTIKSIYSDFWSIYTSKVDKKLLKPEKIQTIEINWLSTFLNGKLTSSLSLFKNIFSDLITRRQMHNPETDKYYWLYQNYEKMVCNGLELNIKIYPIHNLQFELSCVFQNSNYEKTDSVKIGYSPEHLGYIKISYRYKNIIAAATCNYVDDMLANWDPRMKNSDGIVTGGREALPVNDYFKINSNIRVEDLPVKNLYFNFNVSNVLNEEIRYVAGPDEFTRRGFISEPRNFTITLGLKF